MESDKYILGVSSIYNYTHDNSAVLLKKGDILFASSEERFTRIKHDGSFPENAIQSLLNYLKIKPSFIKKIASGYPKRNPLSILYNRYFYEIIPFSAAIILNRNLGLLKDIVNIFKLLFKKSSEKIDYKILKKRKILYIDHHLSHAASAYYTSGFKKSIVIAIDAFGSKLSGQIRSGAVFLCENGEMNEVLSIPIYASLGLFYMSITYSLGFTPGDGEGKTMGLAAYGNPKKVYKLLKPYSPVFENKSLKPGKDWLAGILPSMRGIEYLFNYTRFGKYLQFTLKNYSREDIAAAAQKILEEQLINIVKYLRRKYPDYNNIGLAGGVFLNVKANKKIMETPGVSNIFIQPNAGDGGVALGAAFVATDKKHHNYLINKQLTNCGLGESFTDKQILKELKKYGAKITYKKIKNIFFYTIDRLLKNKVLGWFQGRAEWGPRALGFRSVLADPRNPKIKDRINNILKNREWFMPFAPSILEEEGNKYFDNFRKSPFMTMIFNVTYQKAKLFPASIHIDNTARPNSVNKQNNPIYYQLMNKWFKQTNLPILLNTSFNRHGLPIVNSPEDAIDHLIMGAVDELIIGNYIVKKA